MGLTLVSLEIQIKKPENVSEKKTWQNDRDKYEFGHSKARCRLRK
jgi:hypothetical protein